MKKILFVVCTHGDELAGLDLFLKYPYGKNEKVEWKVVVGNPKAMLLNLRYVETNLNRSFNKTNVRSYEEKRAQILKKIMTDYDVVYDMHTTTDIRSSVMWNRCLFVNAVDDKTLAECNYIDAPFIVWDKDTTTPSQFLTYHAKVGITLEYTKTENAEYDKKRIEKDFLQIIHQKVVPKAIRERRIFTEAYMPVTQLQKNKLYLSFKELVALTSYEKKKLKLDMQGEYYPIFINTPKVSPQYYCFLNKRIKTPH